MKDRFKFAVIGGDGVGPEVTEEAVKVLQIACSRKNAHVEFVRYPFGAEHFIKTKELISDEHFEELKKYDSILLGAVGDPRFPPGQLEFGIVGRLRFDLDLYVNLRPIKIYAEHLCPIKHKDPRSIDILVCRENTEDAYRGRAHVDFEGQPNERVVHEMIYSKAGCERIIRFAFDRARERKKKLTLVDKANAVEGHRYIRKIFERIAADYKDIQTDMIYVDACCMWMVKNPESFDTIVTTNMFGDIITDLGAMIQGGLGIAAGGNINPGKVSVFEPIHGSAPKYKGLKKTCPLAAIMAGAMMMDHCGRKDIACDIETAVLRALNSGEIKSIGTDSGIPTDKFGDIVAGRL